MGNFQPALTRKPTEPGLQQKPAWRISGPFIEDKNENRQPGSTPGGALSTSGGTGASAWMLPVSRAPPSAQCSAFFETAIVLPKRTHELLRGL